MRQFQATPSMRDRRSEEGRRQFVSSEQPNNNRRQQPDGEPAKFNTRAESQRISLENDLYERQSS